MILIVLFALLIASLRIAGEIYYERKFPKRTLPLFLVFIGIALYALTNL